MRAQHSRRGFVTINKTEAWRSSGVTWESVVQNTALQRSTTRQLDMVTSFRTIRGVKIQIYLRDQKIFNLILKSWSLVRTSLLPLNL